MAVTYSANGNVFKATAQADSLTAKEFKALFWYCVGATVGATKLEILETDGSGHLVYADVAEQENFCKPIPCPAGAVEGLYISDLDEGYIFGYIERP